MMTNLFSIFDPATPVFSSSNWAAPFIILLLMPSLLWVTSSRPSLIIKKIVSYVYGEFSPIVKKSPSVLILPLSLFMVIMFNNAPSLLPYIFAGTSHMSFTMAMSLPVWLGVMGYAISNNTQNLLAHLIPVGTPAPLMPLMTLIEMTSNIIRPLTLAVRLAANMIAGHLLIVLLMSASLLIPTSALPFLMMPQIALASLEVAVAFIQAYVFSVLTSLYVAEATS